MPFLMASFVFGFVLPLAALILAIRAYRMARRPPATPRLEERVGSLEAEVRALLHRVRTLEGGADADAAAPQSARLPAIDSATGIESGVPVDPVGGADVDAAPLGGEVAPPPIAPTMMEPVPLTPAAASHVEAAPPPFQPAPPAAIDLEQRIG